MRRLNKQQDQHKTRGLRVSDKTWEEFLALKKRGKTWDSLLKELLDLIDRFKKL